MGAALILLAEVLFVAAGAAIGHRKGRMTIGVVLGLFGLLGLLVLAFIPKTRERQIRESQRRQQVDAAAWARQQDIDRAAQHLNNLP